ncbi:DNRLRE domain-containing protein [Streptomyces sp. enrichment culture]|uniref:DNRLRE domain-containing protein n=1 Tax=Streptomyces sp. enrichment culture TaxID=1795815 RepID=UPI003F54F44C
MSPSTRSTPSRRARRSRVAAAAAFLLLAEAGIALTGQAAAASDPDRRTSAEAAQAPEADPREAGTERAARHAKGSKEWARLEARKTGKKVVATDETTATSYTVANPDGTLTTELTSGPERVWRAGAWRTVDATLTRTADGTVKAKEHPNGLRLAGKGGTAPRSPAAARDAAPRDLVTLGSGEQAVTLQWKGGLPAPDLDGTTARYPEAVPGADVVVEATRTGFEQYVEIKERPSGAYAYTLPVKAKGLKATANKDGSVTFTDTETGERRATMPAPVMWDASVDERSGEHTRRSRVDMKVVNKGTGRIDLVVTPSAEFLASPGTRYPVTVDPSTSALASTFDTYVQRGETVDWSADTELDFGNPGTTNADGTTRVARSFIHWNTTPIQDALIIDTNLALWNFHSGNTDCTAQTWTVWDTTAASTSSRWTNQPTWNTKYHSSTQTRGNPDCTATQPEGWINADVDTLVQTWASAKATRGYMGLRTETDDTRAWKRVNSGNATANQPKLTVTYNYRPSDGTAQQAGPPFDTYNGVWAVNTLTPTLRDQFTDADGDKVSGNFQVYDAETNTPITTPAGDGVLVSGFVTPGEWATVTVPEGQLVDGKMYKFRTNAYDGTHYNLGWSPWRTFVVETAAAGVPTSLQPGDTYTINDPALIADPAQVEQVLNRDGNLEALGIKPRTGPSAEQPSAATSGTSSSAASGTAPGRTVGTTAAWERTYTVPSERFIRGRKPENNGQDPYEYIADVDECHDADDSDNASGWIKNRFSYCQETLTVMPAIRCGLWPPGCYLLGTFISTNTLIGRGQIGGLGDSTLTRVAEFDFNVDVFLSTGDFNKAGAKLEAELECEGDWDIGVPGSPTDEEACQPGLYTGRTDSPSQWKYDGDTKFDLWSLAPRLPDVTNGDQIATGLFTPVLKFTIPGYSQLIPSEGEQGEVRFDSAAYNVRAKAGSVFPDATPALRYDRSDTSDPSAPVEPYIGVAAVADHIGDALDDPSSTYPTKSDKTLPGGSALNPMHRLVPGFGLNEQARYDANRSVVSSTCNNAAVPGRPTAGEQRDCDEFPFASSYQGAARYQYEGDAYRDDFSVRYIDSDENQEAGRRLGAWYDNDRILSHDPFIVVIGD